MLQFNRKGDMYRLSQSQIDLVIWYRWHLLLAGIGLMVLALSLPQGWGCGGLSGFMLFSLATYSFAFRKWRSETGLWMLAALITALLLPCWVYLELLQLNAIRKVPGKQLLVWKELRLLIDAMIALVVFALTIRFAISVAIENRRLTK